MRLNQKRKVLELLNTINEGIDYASITEWDKANRMLKDCNEGLVVLSNLLSEEQKVCRLLKKAIDSIHSIMVGIHEKKVFLLYLNKIKKLISEIRLMIIDEVETEIEIAFFPYKVSMWDSLESIYKEAEKDPNCTCYVVPIPYYEKNSKGEIVRFCYEGNQFPDDINITLFEMYDFEKRQPDIIYIHNPFDEYNRLTMVQPRFFSSNLAKYTKMLVYVPYFVTGSSNNKKINILPSFLNASKIIVQSKTAKDAFLASGLESSKILDLGSPKIDAMLTADKEKIRTPLYWDKIIGDKKVILFNTSISDLLSTDTWLEQIEQVLNYFLTHTKYVLIWRPHPLLEVTLNTMRPYVLPGYKRLMEKVKNATNIIVDYSSDIYPAVLVSDGLISDYSSIMLQYIITGKPILGLLNEEMIKKDRYYFADYLGCYFTNKGVTVPQFIEMIERNEDLQKEERVSRFVNSINNADGTCGRKIHHFIKKEVMQDLLSV